MYFNTLILLLCFFEVFSDSNSPKVYPDTFVDSGKPFYEFKCNATLTRGQWVSWYQEKPSSKKKFFLRTLKTSIDGHVTIDLLLPVDDSDKDSIIYCIVHDENKWRKFDEVSRSVHIHIKLSSNVHSEKTGNPQIWPKQFEDNRVPEIEITCWAPISGIEVRQRLAWYFVEDPKNKKSEIMVNETRQYTYGGYVKTVLQKTIKPSENGAEIYCAIETLSKIWKTWDQESRTIPVAITLNGNATDVWGPWVGQATIRGDSDIVENTCGAYLDDGEILTWFQNTAPKGTERLAMIQHKGDYGKEEVTLRKTLDSSDIGSQIYCSKETVTMQGDGEIKFNTDADRRALILNAIITREKQESYVESIPNENIEILDEDTELELTCRGNGLVDGRGYFWNIQGPKPKELGRNFNQHFDSLKNETHLKLTMKEVFHERELYCFQGYNLEIELKDRSRISYYYGELARSETITLLLQGHEGTDDSPQIKSFSNRKSRDYTDKSKGVIEETCYAFIKPWNALSWYQTRGLKPSTNDILLNATQLQKHKEGWVTLKLKKTIQNSDNGTKIYCVEKDVLYTGDFVLSKPINKLISINLKRNITSIAPLYISTEPSNEFIIFDDNQELEFICTGSKPVDERMYTWYRQDVNLKLHRPLQHFNKSTIVNKLVFVMRESYYHEDSLFCAQDYVLNLDKPDEPHAKFLPYGELTKSTAIKLLYRPKGNPQDEPLVSPKVYTDQGKSFAMFHCCAFVRPWDALSWYQTKDDKSEHTLLKTVQLQNTTYESGQWVQLTLNKTLQASDKGSQVYCAKQSVMPFGNYSEDRIMSRNISLVFQRDILPMETVTTMYPKYVKFDVNKTVQLTCSASNPVDGRIYRWFRTEPGSNRTVQVPNKLSNETTNILELTLDETYDKNKIFCAEAFRADIIYQNVSYVNYYGVMAESEIFILNLKGKYDNQNIIAVAVTIPVLIILAVLLALWVRRRQPHTIQDDTATSSETPKPKERPKPAVRPKPLVTPNANSHATNQTYANIRPTPAAKPAVTARHKPAVSQDQKQTPTPKVRSKLTTHPDLSLATPNSTPAPISTPAQDDSDAIYGNFITLFSDLPSQKKQPMDTEVTYAALDLPRNKTSPNSNVPNTNTTANIYGKPKTSTADTSVDTKASRSRSAVTTLATSESSPYAQIIGIYTPPTQ